MSPEPVTIHWRKRGRATVHGARGIVNEVIDPMNVRPHNTGSLSDNDLQHFVERLISTIPLPCHKAEALRKIARGGQEDPVDALKTALAALAHLHWQSAPFGSLDGSGGLLDALRELEAIAAYEAKALKRPKAV